MAAFLCRELGVTVRGLRASAAALCTRRAPRALHCVYSVMQLYRRAATCTHALCPHHPASNKPSTSLQDLQPAQQIQRAIAQYGENSACGIVQQAELARAVRERECSVRALVRFCRLGMRAGSRATPHGTGSTIQCTCCV